MDVVLMSASEGVHQLAGNEGDHDDEPDNDDSPEQLLLISRAALREVDENDTKTVERMECDGGDESDLTECHDRCLVGSDHCVIGLGRDADEGSIEHVDQKEEEDSDACDAMRDPGPHSFVSSVQSARRRFGHGASSILIIRVCTSRNYAQHRSRASRDTPERAGSHLNPGNSLQTGIPRLTNCHRHDGVIRQIMRSPRYAGAPCAATWPAGGGPAIEDDPTAGQGRAASDTADNHGEAMPGLGDTEIVKPHFHA